MKLISYLGIVVAVIPFLGIPNSWKTVFFVVVGLTIFSQAYLLKLRSRKKDSNIVFTQNNPE
ncbi:hypothetical protein KKG48_02710 [Patescibacteria group bacterium]|nr:hypothetical protein [Patescibacteria group bacterium]